MQRLEYVPTSPAAFADCGARGILGREADKTVPILLTTFREAVLSVTAPVVALLLLIAIAQEVGWLDFDRLFARSGRGQPVLGAAISAVPGCAGSVTLTRLYTGGTISAATLLAAHLSTMGDAAFVLWAGRPLETLGLTAIIFVLGAVLGMLFQRRAGPAGGEFVEAGESCGVPGTLPFPVALAWVGLLAVAVVSGVAAGSGALWTSALAALLLFGLSLGVPHVARTTGVPRGPFARALAATVPDAAEITAWVMAADVAFTVVNTLAGGVVAGFLHGSVFLDVLLAAAVGLIPGCGPQIVIATLFVRGDLPFAALLANTLSQHGDAIFPLLHSRRRVAMYLSLTGGALGAVAGIVWAAAVH